MIMIVVISNMTNMNKIMKIRTMIRVIIKVIIIQMITTIITLKPEINIGYVHL